MSVVRRGRANDLPGCEGDEASTETGDSGTQLLSVMEREVCYMGGARDTQLVMLGI